MALALSAKAFNILALLLSGTHCRRFAEILSTVRRSLTKSPAVAKVGPTVLVVTDLKDHPRSMIFMSSEKAYATSY